MTADNIWQQTRGIFEIAVMGGSVAAKYILVPRMSLSSLTDRGPPVVLSVRLAHPTDSRIVAIRGSSCHK